MHSKTTVKLPVFNIIYKLYYVLYAHINILYIKYKYDDMEINKNNGLNIGFS